MKTLIIANGKIENYLALQKYVDEAGYIICADGGTRHGRRFGIKPDIIVGDLDSTADADFKFFKEIGVEFEQHPVEKDKTDMEICIEKAMEKSKEIVIIGATGGRTDHYLANILMLSNFSEMGIDILLADENNEIKVLTDNGKKQIEIFGNSSDFVSLIPISERVEGVTTSGLKYELDNKSLEFGSTYSVSNTFKEKSATIKMEKGRLLVIKSKDI